VKLTSSTRGSKSALARKEARKSSASSLEGVLSLRARTMGFGGSVFTDGEDGSCGPQQLLLPLSSHQESLPPAA
jgi:hypothetical protein